MTSPARPLLVERIKRGFNAALVVVRGDFAADVHPALAAAIAAIRPKSRRSGCVVKVKPRKFAGGCALGRGPLS